MANSASQQTFNTAFPFEVSVKNQYQQEESAVFYIVNKFDPTDTQQQIEIDIKVTDLNMYAFKGFNFGTIPSNPPAPSALTTCSPSQSAFVPDANNYNIAIAFRPGTLSQQALEGFTNTLQNSLTSFLQNNTNSCVTNGPIIRATDGALIWYCAFQNDVDITKVQQNNTLNAISFMLNGVSAHSGVGSRSTQVEFMFSNVLKNNEGNVLSFKRSRQVDIINHQGHSFAPLNFGVLGSNVLMNNSNNDFTLYMETLDHEAIQFGKDTTMEFSFPYSESNNDQYMSFGGSSAINASALKIPNLAPVGSAPPFSDPDILTPGYKDFITIQTKAEAISSVPDPIIAQLIAERSALQTLINSSITFYTGSSSAYSQLLDYLTACRADFDNIARCVNAINGSGINDDNYNSQYAANYLLRSQTSYMVPYVLNTNNEFTEQQWSSAYSSIYRLSQGVYNFQSYFTTTFNKNSTFQSDPTKVQEWDANFLTYVKTNFATLCEQFISNDNTYPNLQIDGGMYIAACGALYDYFFSCYQRDSLLSLLKINQTFNTGADFYTACLNALNLVNQKSFTAQVWNTNYDQLLIILNNTSALTTSANGVSPNYNAKNPWMDNDFVSYVTQNFQKLCTTVQNGNSTVPIVPSQNLYDIFWLSYQDSLLAAQQQNTRLPIKQYLSAATYTFNFSNVQLSGLDGIVNIKIAVRNLPGYWDTEFQVPIVKKSNTGLNTYYFNNNIPSSFQVNSGVAALVNFYVQCQESNSVATIFISYNGNVTILSQAGNPITTSGNSLTIKDPCEINNIYTFNVVNGTATISYSNSNAGAPFTQSQWLILSMG
jgi:hypothetical protein